MSLIISENLQATELIDYNNLTVKGFVKRHISDATNPKEQAVKLYYAVRDEIRYDPYGIDLTVEGMRISTTLQTKRGWCVTKAALLAGCCRLLGIPAKLGFADVKNHLSTARMRAIMKTDIFEWHGYTSIYIDGKWVKATPAFNIELCERFRLRALDFDGDSDSIYHPFDLLGNKHMEYVRDRGEFTDVPLGAIARDLQRNNITFLLSKNCDFEKDVDLEK